MKLTSGGIPGNKPNTTPYKHPHHQHLHTQMSTLKRGRPAPKLNRACMLCGMVQSMSQFRNDGCPNCESVLHFQDNEDVIRECTSPSFEGLVAVRGSSSSWVARWLRIENFVPGYYAVRINGKLPDDIKSDLYAQGIEYRPRDGSVQD